LTLSNYAKSTVDVLGKATKRINDLDNSITNVRHELHVYLTVTSFSDIFDKEPFYRIVPIRVYLSESDSGKESQMLDAINNINVSFGFDIADDFPAEAGSWWKRWFVKTHEIATRPEVADRLAKLERALELKGIQESQSRIDVNEAEAASKLLKALEGISNAAIQVGSLLIVKTSNPIHNTVRIRTLTTNEMIHLEKNQTLLAQPESVLHELQKISTQGQNKETQIMP
jgi:hypothetical protein